MANEEHLDILKQGVEVWNQWRRKHLEVQWPDLSNAHLVGADLSGADLSGADLSKAYLSEANFSGANLSEADLNGAHLWKANISNADLSGADLSGADLSGANLSSANLTEADLNTTNLSEANLSGADLSKTQIDDTDFSKSNLNKAILREANTSPGKLCKAKLRKVIASISNPQGIRRPRRITNRITNTADFIEAILTGAELTGANLRISDFSKADLSGANLNKVNLDGSVLTGAKLSKTYLIEANLTHADLTHADLTGANLNKADLTYTNLTYANLTGANLSGVSLIHTNLTQAILNNCLIYGISAWDVQLSGTSQLNLMITPRYEPAITVDNLKIAQFIYLILNNQELRDIIDTITSKVVLILGRFTSDRKAVLDALKKELRNRNYTPIIFDFDIPKGRDITEVVSLLARLSKFIIADITDAKSIPQELSVIIPDLPSVPVQPIILASEKEYGMFEHFKRYPWVLKEYYYTSMEDLLSALAEHIIEPAEKKVKELTREKAKKITGPLPLL